MAKKKKRPTDANLLAKSIVDLATGETEEVIRTKARIQQQSNWVD